jgi:hypothetical protein
MKHRIFSLVVIIAAWACASTCLARGVVVAAGTYFFGPSTAGYTYLANAYPRNWDVLKHSTPHKTYYLRFPAGTQVPTAARVPERQISVSPTRSLRRLGW